MLICLFKLEDVGPTLSKMVVDQDVHFDETTVDKFRFSGTMTYSLIFQGMVTLDDMVSELYGPFPFAFSSGFVQYAYSFMVDDTTVQDKRMKHKTIGLLLMLVPEMVSKIDDFREELAKSLVYRFRKIYKIEQVDDIFLTDIIKEYNNTVTRLLNQQQAEQLSGQIITFLQEKPDPKKETELNFSVIYPIEYTELVRNYFATLLSSLPYEESVYKRDEAYIKTSTSKLTLVTNTSLTKEFIEKQKALIFLVNINEGEYHYIYDLLSDLGSSPKIATVMSLPENLEAASKKYADFFVGLQEKIHGLPYFSASYTGVSEFKSKMLEALLWALTPD